jgi:hypothetical protein
MRIALYRNTLEPSVVYMPFARRVILSVVSHRVRCRNPTHEPVQLAIDFRAENQMPVIVHLLTRKKPDSITIKSPGHDSLKGVEVRLLVKDICTRVSPIKGVVNPACFVCAWWSGHANKATDPIRNSKSPDPFFWSGQMRWPMRMMITVIFVLILAGGNNAWSQGTLDTSPPGKLTEFRYHRLGNTGVQGDSSEAIWVGPDGDPWIGGYDPGFEEGGIAKLIQAEARFGPTGRPSKRLLSRKCLITQPPQAKAGRGSAGRDCTSSI